MANDTGFSPIGLQIARVDARGKILDITDPSPMPQVHDPKKKDREGRKARAPRMEINFCNYGGNESVTHRHWVDCDTLRLLAWDLVNTQTGDKRGKFYEPILNEYKGGDMERVGSHEFDRPKLISRRMSVSFNDGLDMGEVYQVNFEAKDGVRGKTGQVTPDKGGETYFKDSINIPVETARKVGLCILEHLQAKRAAAYATHRFARSISHRDDEEDEQVEV